MVDWWQQLPERINPVAFSIGFFGVRYYALMYIAAFLTVYGLVRWRLKREPRFRISSKQLETIMVALIIGMLVGARLGYVLFYNLSYYIQHPLEAILPLEFQNGIRFVGFSGMSYHGGVIPAGGTFFVFSDYMKPAVRLAALMELPVIYIWTHDAFRVGEDGPTHQPVEHEAQIRLLEKLKNHSGKPSLLALRPADGAETTVAWKLALENRHTPTALILSRQSIADLPSAGLNRYREALQTERGGYIVEDCSGRPALSPSLGTWAGRMASW